MYKMKIKGNIKNTLKIVEFIFVLLVIALVIYLVWPKKEVETSYKQKVNVLQITEFIMPDRTVIKKKQEIYVGNNEKELDNGFYDIKIENTSYGVSVYLNKLWYETYGKDFIQDEYLARICRELTYRLNIQNTDQEFEYMLYKYIKDNYVKVRQSEPVEELKTNVINLELELYDNMVKLTIKRGE